MATSSRFRAVLYDLDGTLLNTISDIARAMNAELSARGFPVHHVDEYRSMVGWGLEELVRKALPATAVDDAQVRVLLSGMKQRYDAEPVVETVPYAGVVELLSEVNRLGIPQAILSNKADEIVHKVVGKTLSAVAFSVVIGARAGVPNKPDPTAALEVCARMDIPPSACCYVGDSEVDMETARAAGMFPIGVSWGFRSVEQLKKAGAGAIVSRPSQLLEMLRSER